MSSSSPVSVLLPTISWTPVIDELADQLRPSDELLVVCDSATDPVVDRLDDGAFESVRLVVAGEPEGCSGKANAIAAGMEAARHDRLIWTDDDFHHPDGWLDSLREEYERRGPTTELPFFVGRDPLAVFFEPLYAVGGTAAVYVGNVAWGGAVVFDRADLPDERAFLRELRRAVSDDGLLTDHVDITPVKRIRRVKIGGSVRETLERHVRFTQIVRHHDPLGNAVVTVLGTLLAGSAALFPIPGLVAVTASFAVVYVAFGLRRWTVLLAYPAVVAFLPFTAYGLLRRTFVWGGRRYRWAEKFDVEVVE
ncbi:glycosyltransferase (plasmid) [Haloferacaceae archaeon DSL9]